MRFKDLPWFGSVLSERIAIIVAHQDDEVFFSSVLTHHPQALVVHVTDGAPDDPTEWKHYGSREAYARVRTREARRALSVAGHAGGYYSLGVKDSQAMPHVPAIRVRLHSLMVLHRIDVVCTHAYEGGHPDHDAIAAAVHAIAGVRRIIEAPFYRKHYGHKVWQTFVPSKDRTMYRVELSRIESLRKSDMIAAHESQAEAMRHVSRLYEYFREAPRYDFSKPPNDGNLARNYERVGISAMSWPSLV